MQARKYSSSVDSAGTAIAVVTPPGDTSIAPGCGLVVVVPGAAGDGSVVSPGSDEHPESAAATAAVVTVARIARLRMASNLCNTGRRDAAVRTSVVLSGLTGLPRTPTRA
ncbi:RING finger protein unkempt-like protein [Mycolicibacterium thermoresistibile]|uniref:RING finger protein unkempt-like protein n=1 Tax=Mycolicibacterium thermoresistibile TaxID=1797 RepID=A0A100XDR1_MYCTH|nr:RING finger protein unkempt-like protein [Mycolicibacterium thermoresistibile]